MLSAEHCSERNVLRIRSPVGKVHLHDHFTAIKCQIRKCQGFCEELFSPSHRQFLNMSGKGNRRRAGPRLSEIHTQSKKKYGKKVEYSEWVIILTIQTGQRCALISSSF